MRVLSMHPADCGCESGNRILYQSWRYGFHSQNSLVRLCMHYLINQLTSQPAEQLDNLTVLKNQAVAAVAEEGTGQQWRMPHQPIGKTTTTKCSLLQSPHFECMRVVNTTNAEIAFVQA